MNETIVKKLRSGMTGMIVLAAICALLGAIAIFVTNGISESDNYLSDGEEVALTVVQMVAWDVLRMGGFGMFACSFISVVVELFGKASGKMYSFVMLVGSVFGLISGFILSATSVAKAAEKYDFDSQGFFILPCVFAILSAVFVFVGLGIRSYRPAPLAYPPQGYPQQYPQGYPQQGVPQQAYPQQYPQQQYPQQSVPVQQPVDPNDPGSGQ